MIHLLSLTEWMFLYHQFLFYFKWRLRVRLNIIPADLKLNKKSAGPRENQTSLEKWKNSVLCVAKISLCKLLVLLQQSVMKGNLLILYKGLAAIKQNYRGKQSDYQLKTEDFQGEKKMRERERENMKTLISLSWELDFVWHNKLILHSFKFSNFADTLIFPSILHSTPDLTWPIVEQVSALS